MQARADCEAVEEEQGEAERHEKRREDRKAEEASMLEGFEPILNLDQFHSLPAAQPLNKPLQQQLVWYRVVGGNEDLLAGLFKGTGKEKLKELLVGALEHRNERMAVGETKMVLDGGHFCSQNSLKLRLMTENIE